MEIVDFYYFGQIDCLWVLNSDLGWKMMGLTTFVFLENVYFILLLLRQLGKILLCRTCYTAVELSG